MPLWPGMIHRVNRILLRRGWLVLACIGLVAVSLDIIERYQSHSLSISSGFISEVFFEGLALPVLGGLLLNISERSFVERNYFFKYLTLKDALVRQINVAPQWDDLIKAIVEFPRSFLPLIGTVLVMHEPGSDQMGTKAVWGFYGVPLLPLRSTEALPACRYCVTRLAFHGPVECNSDYGLSLPVKTARYCLPLVIANLPVATLYLYLPSHMFLSQAQEDLLVGLAPVMALAIEAGRQKRLTVALKESAEAERRKIARNLHDNLAQDLILLRHKLDQLTIGDGLEKGNLQRDLCSLREIVEDAYVNVRSTLKEIESSSSTELSAMLQDYIRSVDEQAGLTFHYSSSGMSQQLPARVAHQLLYIFGEALSNIEEHAGASQVQVRLDWGRGNLILSIADNGRGFDLHADHQDGHMGLKIMHERAEEIHGILKVKSEPGAGTEITLTIPVGSQV
jgi:signal transduction histidine kinase